MPRPRIVSEEALRQAMRAHRKAKRPAFLSAEEQERAARRLQSRVEKGHIVDAETVKGMLQDREREYLQCKQALEGLERQREVLLVSARRLEGAMLALRVALGDEAPPVPQELQPAAPVATNDTEPAPPPENMQ
ncbi:MAG TPA: hypothetical protein VMI75_05320 [Polyangiaceae bacterium]|nr:hypothetical protein [Polyangiaceae bacterium]